MITDFPPSPVSNIAGLSSFRFIPSHHVISIPPIVNFTISTAMVLWGYTRLLNGVSVIGSLNFEEEKVNDENGTSYNWKVTGFYPGNDPAATILFAGMEADQVEHLVVVRDNSGRQRLVGYGAPLTFSATYSSGTAPGEAKGYTFAFSGRGKDRAPYYTV